MNDTSSHENQILETIQTIRKFVGEITGIPPSEKEICDALKRYFILKEILDQIVWDREHPEHRLNK